MLTRKQKPASVAYDSGFFFPLFLRRSHYCNMSTEQVTDSLKDLSLSNDPPKDTPSVTNTSITVSPKPKAAFDKVALRERWKILGTDAEQSNALQVF
jgi:hypothetical protein